VIWCRSRPVRGEMPDGEGHQRRLASPGGLQPGAASRARGRHSWRRSKAHVGDNTGGLRWQLTGGGGCSEQRWAARSSWARWGKAEGEAEMGLGSEEVGLRFGAQARGG
jgi:hypothetical protein